MKTLLQEWHFFQDTYYPKNKMRGEGFEPANFCKNRS